jgi:hypothetical protein
VYYRSVRTRGHVIARATSLALLAGVAATACASVLGIEDVSYISGGEPDGARDGPGDRDGDGEGPPDGSVRSDADADASSQPRCSGDAFVEANTGCEPNGVIPANKNCETFAGGTIVFSGSGGSMTSDTDVYVSPPASALASLPTGATSVWGQELTLSVPTDPNPAVTVFNQATTELDVQFLGSGSRVELARIKVVLGSSPPRPQTFTLAINEDGALDVTATLPDGGTQTSSVLGPLDVVCTDVWTHMRIAVKLTTGNETKVSTRFQASPRALSDLLFPTAAGPRNAASASLTIGLARAVGAAPIAARFDNVHFYIE